MTIQFQRQQDFYNLLTHDPEKEVWFRLSEDESEFSVKNKMQRYYKEEKISFDPSSMDEVAAYFVFCLKQGREYFSAAKTVSILTRPLLMFYGMVCLAKLIIILKNPSYPKRLKKQASFNKHGLGYRNLPDENFLINNDIVRLQDKGTFALLYSFFSPDMPQSNEYKISELYGWIPDMYTTFGNRINIKAKLATVTTSIVENNGYITAKIQVPSGYNIDKNSLFENYPFLQSDFEKREEDDAIVFLGRCHKNRKKIVNGKNSLDDSKTDRNSIDEIEKYLSEFVRLKYLGTEYLIPQGNHFVLNPLLASYMLMYGLSRVCRYNPTKWGELIEGKKSNEKWLIEKFIDLCSSTFPWEIFQIFTDKPVSFS